MHSDFYGKQSCCLHRSTSTRLNSTRTAGEWTASTPAAANFSDHGRTRLLARPWSTSPVKQRQLPCEVNGTAWRVLVLVCRCLDIGRAINARLRRAEDEGKPPFRVLRECLSLRISSRVARLALVTESDTVVPLMESSHRGGRGRFHKNSEIAIRADAPERITFQRYS